MHSISYINFVYLYTNLMAYELNCNITLSRPRVSNKCAIDYIDVRTIIQGDKVVGNVKDLYGSTGSIKSIRSRFH